MVSCLRKYGNAWFSSYLSFVFPLPPITIISENTWCTFDVLSDYCFKTLKPLGCSFTMSRDLGLWGLNEVCSWKAVCLQQLLSVMLSLSVLCVYIYLQINNWKLVDFPQKKKRFCSLFSLLYCLKHQFPFSFLFFYLFFFSISVAGDRSTSFIRERICGGMHLPLMALHIILFMLL